MEVSALVSTFGEGFRSFLLDASFRFSYIHELRESTIDISNYLLPSFGVKAWVTFGDLADYDPGVKFGNILREAVRINRLHRSHFEAYWAHVMVVAVVDVSPVFRLKAIFQILEGLIFVYIVRD